MPDDIIKKKEEGEDEDEEKKKLAKEKKEFHNEKLALKRNQYVALGGEKLIAKKNDSNYKLNK